VTHDALTPCAGRRIAAVVLPDLPCELVSASAAPRVERSPSRHPLGVVLVEHAPDESLAAEADDPEAPVERPVLKSSAVLDAVNDVARRFGVREGQSIAEATALVAQLRVCELPNGQLSAALGRVAEIGLSFGPTVSIEAPDTVWVDVTGAAHLAGGEAALAAELGARVRELGHVARVAVASGPRLSQAFARWKAPASAEKGIVVAAEHARTELSPLPVLALPIDRERAAWLLRLGVLTIGDLAKLPRAAAAARLGENAATLLDLCEGRDPAPLVAYEPPRVLVEEVGWEYGVDTVEPLLFALRGVVSRLSGRLTGRGEAAQSAVLSLLYDRSAARLAGIQAGGRAPARTLDFELATPLSRDEDIRRVLGARLERTELEVPCIGLRLEVPELTAAPARQLDLSRVMPGMAAACQGAESLPVVLAELAADIGKERVGVLRLLDTHRPEQKQKLARALPRRRSGAATSRSGSRKTPLRKTRPPASWFSRAPTRLLSPPVRLHAALRAGATLSVERQFFTIENLAFENRLEAVEWWSGSPVSRDYLRLWLRNRQGVVEALVYVDRESGERYLQAIAD
jgi:protein ImuB